MARRRMANHLDVGLVFETETIQTLPFMTGPTAPTGYEATASTTYDATATYQPWRAFDGSVTNSFWAAANGNSPHLLSRKMARPTRVGAYALGGLVEAVTCFPVQWYFCGSNDGVNLTILDNRTGASAVTTWISQWDRKVFEVPEGNKGFFNYYHLYILQGGGNLHEIAEFELFQDIVYPVNRTLRSQDVFAARIVSTVQNVPSTVSLPFDPDMGWLKLRQFNADHYIWDSTRGDGKLIIPNSNAAEVQTSGGAGTLRPSVGRGVGYNVASTSEIELYFKKWRHFLDIVTWIGDGTNNRKIPHKLRSVPGSIWGKKRLGAGAGLQNWACWHRSYPQGIIQLNGAVAAQATPGIFETGSVHVPPTATDFTVSADARLNESGMLYVAFLWGHNTDAATGLIQCGTAQQGGSVSSVTQVTLPWMPQLVFWKGRSAGNWTWLDTARGWAAGNDPFLRPGTNEAEIAGNDLGAPNSTGFTFTNVTANEIIDYVAIRGPM